MEADAEIKKEILNMLDKYAECYLNKDIVGLMSLFVSDPDLVAFGTGIDEIVKGVDELKTGILRDFSQGDDIRLVFENLTISAAGKVAWLSGSMTMHAIVGGEGVILPGRVSMVLEEKDNGWLFTHLHYSVPAQGQSEGESWPE
jgi:ketosteroid isomerase-like protein